MGSHIALVRAINVGGRNRVAMADLRELFANLGFVSAQTFLQSGNVVFDGGSKAGPTLERTLEAECTARLALDTDFMVRSARQWNDIVANNPFPDEADEHPGQLAVVFLKKPASGPAVRSLASALRGRESIEGGGKQVYIVYPDGIGRSRLTAPIIERALNSSCTARNWNTVLKVHAAVSRTAHAD